MATSLTTDVGFPLFAKLLPELRTEIWRAAYEIFSTNNIISVRDHLDPPPAKFDITGPLSLTNDVSITRPLPSFNDRRALLYVNGESRKVAFPRLTSAFGPPIHGYHLVRPPTLSWHNHSRELLEKLFKFLRNEGFERQARKILQHPGHVEKLAAAVLVHYNARPHEAFTHTTIFGKSLPFPSLEPALWFDLETNYLLIPLPRVYPNTDASLDRSMRSTQLASKVKRLVLKLDHGNWNEFTYRPNPILPQMWSRSLETGEVDFPALERVQEVCLLNSAYEEMAIFTMAPVSAGLKPGQWAFSLDTTHIHVTPFSSLFDNPRCIGEIWRIVFGRTPDPAPNSTRFLNVCELLRDLEPRRNTWKFDKMVVRKEVLGIEPDFGAGFTHSQPSPIWLKYNRARYMERKEELAMLPWVDEEGRKAWLAPKNQLA